MEASTLQLLIQPIHLMSLPPTKHRWVTAACILPLEDERLEKQDEKSRSGEMLVCGDKDGSVHVFDLSSLKESSLTEEMVS